MKIKQIKLKEEKPFKKIKIEFVIESEKELKEMYARTIVSSKFGEKRLKEILAYCSDVPDDLYEILFNEMCDRDLVLK